MAEITPAPSQPAPQAQSSDAPKRENLTFAQAVQRLAAEPAPQAPEAPSAPAVENITPSQDSVSTEAVEALADGSETAPQEPVAPPEAEADEALSHKTSFTPEQQAIFDKRLGKEVAKRKQLEAELAQARTPREPEQALPPVIVQPTQDQPLANITDLGQLSKIANDTRQIKYLAEEALDAEGVEVNGAQIGDKVYTKAQLQAIRRNAQRQLEEAVPQRQHFLQTRAQMDAKAIKDFPYLADKSSPEAQQAIAILRDPRNSYLHYVTNALEQVALQIEGGRAVAERNKAAVAKPKPIVKAPASQATFGAATGSVRQVSDQGADRRAGELKKLSGKGNVTTRDAARFFALNSQ